MKLNYTYPPVLIGTLGEILTNKSLTYFEAFPGTKVNSNYTNKLPKMP